MSAHVLFDLEATRSFVYLALSKKFQDAPETLDSPLEVEIAHNHNVSAARVYHDYVMNVLREWFRVDLVLILLRGLQVIFRMD